MSRCRFNVNDECVTHAFSERCYTDALPDRYCFAACPHDDGVYPDTAITLRCLNCQVMLPLGPANDSDERVMVEKDLADVLAEAHTGEWTIDGLDVDDLEGGAIDAMLDIDFARQLAAEARRGRPRSPIEMMVDRACGIATHDQTHGGG